MTNNEDREKMLEAEFCTDESLVGEGEGLVSGVVAIGKVLEVDIPDGVVVDKDGVGVEGGVSRLEGIGTVEVSDGIGESREPVMLLILNDTSKTRSGDLKRRETWTHVKKEEY